MTTYVTGGVVDVLVGHPWLYTLTWRNPDGTAVDLAGMSVSAEIDSQPWGGSIAVPVSDRTDTAGAIVLALAASSTAGIPLGRLSTLVVTYTDTSGQDHVLANPLRGLSPGDTPSTLATGGAWTAVVAQGPAGVMGPAGPPSTDLSFVAASPMSGHRAVYLRPDGVLDYASADLPASLDGFLGLTCNGGVAGATILVRVSGEMVESSWSWNIGPLWLGLAGTLTQVDPGVADTLLIGMALGATRILIDPDMRFRAT